tara:strand:- start:683 stop:1045 length:363 start_codon:yes stop_codon:yes gene_type:complete
MNRVIVNDIKDLINLGNVQGVKDYINDYIANINSLDYKIDQLDIFKLIFNHSCSRGNKELIEWFLELYLNYFNDIEKIAARQLFFYGKYVIINESRYNIKNKNSLIHWYDTNVIPKIKCA